MQVLGEPVARFLKHFGEPPASVRVVDDESQGVAADAVLAQGYLDDVVRWVHVDAYRAVAIHVGVLVAAQVRSQ